MLDNRINSRFTVEQYASRNINSVNTGTHHLTNLQATALMTVITRNTLAAVIIMIQAGRPINEKK